MDLRFRYKCLSFALYQLIAFIILIATPSLADENNCSQLLLSKIFKSPVTVKKRLEEIEYRLNEISFPDVTLEGLDEIDRLDFSIEKKSAQLNLEKDILGNLSDLIANNRQRGQIEIRNKSLEVLSNFVQKHSEDFSKSFDLKVKIASFYEKYSKWSDFSSEQKALVKKICETSFGPISDDLEWQMKMTNELLSHTQEEFDRIFKTSGYPDYETYVKALRKTKNPKIKKLISAIENEEIEVVVQQSDGIRELILKNGILNQHADIQSMALNNSELRNSAESGMALFGDMNAYSDLNHHIKPKYCYLRPKKEIGNLDYNFEENMPYAFDRYILKTKNIKNRMTWHPSDSLDRSIEAGAASTKGTTYSEFTPKSWDQTFIPWKDRLLMVPLLAPEYLHSGVFDVAIENQRYIRKLSDLANYKIGLRSAGFERGNAPSYLEVQVFGPISIDDIEAFVFTEALPDQHFVNALKKQGIKIYDGRKDKLHPVPWEE